MGEIATLRCVSCGREFSPDAVDYTCPDCGPRRGTLEVLYDYDALRAKLTRDHFARETDYSM